MHQEVAALEHLLLIRRDLPSQRISAASFYLTLYEVIFRPLLFPDTLSIGILPELVVLLVLDLLELVLLLPAFHPVQE